MHKVPQPSAAKDFEVSDGVRILESGLHHQKDRKVVAISLDRVENDYRIAFDKKSHLSREVIVILAHSQKFPSLRKL